MRQDGEGTTISLEDLNQRLTFPDEERLKELLVLEYGREEHFAIWVNDGQVTVDDIPGQQYQYEAVLPYAGPVRLFFKVSPEKEATAAPRNSHSRRQQDRGSPAAIRP